MSYKKERRLKIPLWLKKLLIDYFEIRPFIFWPKEIVAVRHGESIGNLVVRAYRNKLVDLYTDDFKNLASFQWPLTKRGKDQAFLAGQWIKANIGEIFDGYFTSPFLRARQTAQILDLPNARWIQKPEIKGRIWGNFDLLTPVERETLYPQEIRLMNLDKFYNRPPGGESMEEISLRVTDFLKTLKEEYAGKRVIIVCHGEVMLALRLIIENIEPQIYEKIEKEDVPFYKMYNAQVLHYTREDPEGGELSEYYSHVRSVCPWNLLSVKKAVWHKIETSPFLRNEELVIESEIPKLPDLEVFENRELICEEITEENGD